MSLGCLQKIRIMWEAFDNHYSCFKLIDSQVSWLTLLCTSMDFTSGSPSASQREIFVNYNLSSYTISNYSWMNERQMGEISSQQSSFWKMVFKRIWFGYSLSLRIENDSTMDFSSWLTSGSLNQTVPKSQLTNCQMEILGILWAIWSELVQSDSRSLSSRREGEYVIFLDGAWKASSTWAGTAFVVKLLKGVDLVLQTLCSKLKLWLFLLPWIG